MKNRNTPQTSINESLSIVVDAAGPNKSIYKHAAAVATSGIARMRRFTHRALEEQRLSMQQITGRIIRILYGTRAKRPCPTERGSSLASTPEPWTRISTTNSVITLVQTSRMMKIYKLASEQHTLGRRPTSLLHLWHTQTALEL